MLDETPGQSIESGMPLTSVLSRFLKRSNHSLQGETRPSRSATNGASGSRRSKKTWPTCSRT